MKIYIACASLDGIEDMVPNSDILIAYPYIHKCDTNMALISQSRNFILDSGVFTMINSGKRFDIDKYVDEYAEFIRDHKIKQYVEMDVDQIYGVEKTRKLRERIENRVGWQSIPVWHTIRGKESFEEDCRNYDYIALGYFLTEGLSSQLTIKYAKAFVKRAHELNCRIHGLGFTRTTLLDKIPSDSVDSSTWSISKRYGHVSKYDPKRNIIQQMPKPAGTRMKEGAYIQMGQYSFREWRKYQDWAYKNLPPIWQ